MSRLETCLNNHEPAFLLTHKSPQHDYDARMRIVLNCHALTATLLLLGYYTTPVESSGAPFIIATNISSPTTCEARTINYITHTLPQQCGKASWSHTNSTSPTKFVPSEEATRTEGRQHHDGATTMVSEALASMTATTGHNTEEVKANTGHTTTEAKVATETPKGGLADSVGSFPQSRRLIWSCSQDLSRDILMGFGLGSVKE